MEYSEPSITGQAADLAARIDEVLAELDEEELEELLAEDGAVAALDQADAIREVAASLAYPQNLENPEYVAQCVSFLRHLVAAGLDLNQTAEGPSPLEAVVSFIPAEHGRDLVRDMIAAGADPNVRSVADEHDRYSALDTVVTRHPSFWPLVEPHASDEGLCGALVALIRAGRGSEDAMLTDILGRPASIDVNVPGIIPPLHAAALSGDLALLRAVLARVADPGLTLAEHHRIDVKETSIAGGGASAGIQAVPGMTALDVVASAQDLLTAKIAKLADGDRAGGERMIRHLDGLTACHAELLKAGTAASGIVVPPPAEQPYRAVIDEQLFRLAALQGHDTGELQARLDVIDTAGRAMGPYGYLRQAIDGGRRWLVTGRVEDHLGALGHIMAEDPFGYSGYPDFEFEDGADSLDYYPPECRAGLEADIFLARDDDILYFLWPHGRTRPGAARVCRADYDGFEVLGDSVEDFLERQVTKISRAAGERS